MADSWRIDTLEINNSQSVTTDLKNIGASVIRSYKGSEEPVYIPRGSESKITSLFGTPTSVYPDIWEVIEYNKKASIWLSAPARNGTYGGVHITKTGSVPFLFGDTDKTIDYDNLSYTEQMGIGDGIIDNFVFTIKGVDYYKHQSVDIEVNGTTINVSATDADPEVLTTSPDVGSGTYDRTTGIVDFTFTAAPALNDVITVSYGQDVVDQVYFSLFAKNKQADDLAIKTSYTNDTFVINAYEKSGSDYIELQNSPYTVSLTPGALDGFGGNIYIEEVFENDDYFTVVVNEDLAFSTYAVEFGKSSEISIGNGIDTEFSNNINSKDVSTYVNQSIDITVNGISINVAATDAATEVLTTTPDVGSGTYVRATGLLTFTFDTEPAENAIIKATYNVSKAEDGSQVDLFGGNRGDIITITELKRGWDYFKDKVKYPVDIFFDCTANPGIVPLFETLRNTYQKYKAYLLPLPDQDAASAITTRQGYGTNDRGLYFYWNWAYVSNAYTNSKIKTSLMGRVAGKHADMVDVFNGLAPCWIGDATHNGLLGSGIIKLTQTADEDTLQLLDEAQINPIHYYPEYGFLIVSQRTSYRSFSDYSFIGHSRVIDYAISNIVSQVLPFQVEQLNDDSHRAIAKNKTDSLLNPLISAPYNLLREFFVKCDSENNNDSVLARREFVLGVVIKVTPFSRKIKLLFVNAGQETSIEETFE